MPFTSLFAYKPVFALQLFIIELMFTIRLRKRSHFPLRLIGGGVFFLCVSVVFPVGDYGYNAPYCAFMFLCLFALSVGVLCYMYSDKFSNILLGALAGYTVQHISQELYETISVLMDPSGQEAIDFYGSGNVDFEMLSQNWLSVMKYFFAYLATYVAVYFAAYFLFAARMGKYDDLPRRTVIPLVAFILVADVIVSSVITYLVPREGNFVASLLLHMYNVAACVVAIVLLFELPRRKQLENKFAVTSSLLRRAEEKYNMSKETVELINIKCHDMKHRLRRLAERSNVAEGAAKEMEELINIYDADYRTSNEALNIVLMEKSLVCRRLGITMTCIADGDALSFMTDADIYSLFDNLLDNATEAAARMEKGNRSIGLSVREMGGFAVINVYNGYDGNIEYEDGLPRTTKADRTAHGYGMKSIRYVVGEYGGEMTINAEGGIFSVDIAIPVPHNGGKVK